MYSSFRLALGLFVGLLPLVTLQAESPPVPGVPVKPLQVLLIVGGCCHDYDAQKNIIAKGLEERAHVLVTQVHQGGSSTDAKIELYEKANWAEGYDLVIHDECFAAVKDKAWVDQILKPHRQGLPAVVLHCAMHCYRTGADDWFEFCGVTSHRHGAAYPHEVLTRDGTHPIMKHAGAGWFNPAGELYHIEKVWPKAHPLASAKNRENGREEVCVWTNHYRDQTRVFGTTLGHHNETVRSDEFLNLLTHGMLWACNKTPEQYLKPAQPKVVPVNLAKGKPAVASSEEPGKPHAASKAFDENPQTRWCPNGPGKNEWLQVDLGKPEKLTGCHIRWEGENNVYQHRIEGSADGKTWQILYNGEQHSVAGITNVKFEAENIRYLKLTFLGSSQGGWGSLWEWEVFGTQMHKIEPPVAGRFAGDALLKDVKVPPGYEATIFAAPPAAVYPVFLSAAPNGDVYAAVDKNGSLGRLPNYGAIYRMRDLNGDGRADESRLFVPNVDSPRGMAWDHDRLYVLHPPHVSAFIDRDGDGTAEEQQVLVKNIAFTFKDRPADHTSNGLTLGIDGWLYLAIGDFGFMEAEGTDGRKLQLRGGGVVRVRPDGTGLELYSRGTRNILKVAVDPLLNGFSRDNTNDGGGWDIRLHHYTGMENHGYPSQFKNFGDEVVQPLADYGGGSGCGGLFLNEPGFPGSDGNALLTCDWGRSWIYKHHPKPNGATFTVDESQFISAPKVVDVDVDANSHLYLTSWKDGGFSFSTENIGFIARVTPQGYQPEPLPDFKTASEAELLQLLQSKSHRRRLEAQRTLVRRGLKDSAVTAIKAMVLNPQAVLEVRVAALFTLKQGLEARATSHLVEFTKDAALREHAIRALADRLEENKEVPTAPLVAGLKDENPRVRLAALVALARVNRLEPAPEMTALLADSDPIVRHTAVQALIALKASQACFSVVDNSSAPAPQRVGALRVLQGLHDTGVVGGLLERWSKETDPLRRNGLISALCRLYHRDAEWKGSSWGTRPDTSGPYYEHATWAESNRILETLKAALARSSGEETSHLLFEASRHKIQIDGALDKLINLASANPTLLPTLAEEVNRSGQLPVAAIPLLIQLAKQNDASSLARSQAVQSLTRSDAADAWSVILATNAELLKLGRGKSEVQKARDALINSPKLETQLPLLLSEAAKLNGASSLFAEAALLHLAAGKQGSVEGKAQAKQSIEAGFASPLRHVQLLEAIALIEARSYADQVLAAESHAEAAVAAAAKKAISQLKLDDPKKKPKSNSPLVESLKVEEVVERVLKTKGSVNAGLQLFAKLECAKCHTVKADETPKGPFLGTVASTYKRKELIEAILLPSKTLAQGFVTNQIITEDGKQHTGFVVLEAADKIVLRTAEAKEIVIPVAQIEERNKLTISVMPEGLVKKLTVEELASLVDYIESLPKK